MGTTLQRIVLVVLPCLFSACQRDAPHLEVAARIVAPEIRECSGIVTSRQYPGVFWVHNDSGNPASLFAIDAAGSLLCAVEVQGARNVDWEDLTTDDTGHLYIGDFGNNRNDRRDLEVLVVREPDPFGCDGTGVVPVQRRIPFHFPEQKLFPDPEHMNYDVEALFWLEGALYVFTKHRSDTESVLYRLPSGTTTVAERQGAFEAGGMVTAAAVSPDGKHLLVLTYDLLHEFTLQPGRPLLDGPHRRMLIEARQCEAVDFDDGVALIVNEQREMYRIPLDDWQDVLLPATPVARVDAIEDSPPQEVAWSSIAPLSLRPEYEDGRLPPADPPELKLTRSPTSLYVHVAYGARSLPDDVAGELLIVHVGPDADRRARIASPHDAVVTLTRLQGVCRLQRPGAEDPAAATVREEGDALELRLPLDPVLQEAAVLRVNVIVRRPGAARLHEWAWGGTSSTRPGENVLLWGRLEMRPGG